MSGASAAGRQCRGAAPGGLTASWSGACSGPTEFCSGARRLRRRQADSVLRAAHLRQDSAQRKRRLRRADGMRGAAPVTRVPVAPSSIFGLLCTERGGCVWRLGPFRTTVAQCVSVCALGKHIDFRLNSRVFYLFLFGPYHRNLDTPPPQHLPTYLPTKKGDSHPDPSRIPSLGWVGGGGRMGVGWGTGGAHQVVPKVPKGCPEVSPCIPMLLGGSDYPFQVSEYMYLIRGGS